MAKYRVTYTAQACAGKASVTLSEINEAEDLETAYHYAKDWAVRQRWILKAVEEIE